MYLKTSFIIIFICYISHMINAANLKSQVTSLLHKSVSTSGNWATTCIYDNGSGPLYGSPRSIYTNATGGGCDTLGIPTTINANLPTGIYSGQICVLFNSGVKIYAFCWDKCTIQENSGNSGWVIPSGCNYIGLSSWDGSATNCQNSFAETVINTDCNEQCDASYGSGELDCLAVYGNSFVAGFDQ